MLGDNKKSLINITINLVLRFMPVIYLPIYIRTSTSIKAFKHNYSNFIKEGYADLDSFLMS